MLSVVISFFIVNSSMSADRVFFVELDGSESLRAELHDAVRCEAASGGIDSSNLDDIWAGFDFVTSVDIDPLILESKAREYVKFIKSNMSRNDSLAISKAFDRHISQIAAAGMKDNEVLYLFLDLYGGVLENYESADQDLNLYRDFLKAYLRSPTIKDLDKYTVSYMLEGLQYNMPGDSILSYEVVTREYGPQESMDFVRLLLMGNIKEKGYSILFYYSPDCSECDVVLDEMQRYAPLINSMIDERLLQIVAVYAGHELELWKKKGWSKIPDQWINCMTMDEQYVKDKYSINSTPMIYVIGGDGRVIMRNPSIDKVIEQVLQHRN